MDREHLSDNFDRPSTGDGSALNGHGHAEASKPLSEEPNDLPLTANEVIENALQGEAPSANAFPEPHLSKEQQQALYQGTDPAEKTERARRSRQAFDGHYGEVDKIADGLASDRQHERAHTARATESAEKQVENTSALEEDIQPEGKKAEAAEVVQTWSLFDIVRMIIIGAAIFGLGASAFGGITTFIGKTGMFPEVAEGGLAIYMIALLTISAPIVAHSFLHGLTDMERDRFIKRTWPVFLASVVGWCGSLAYLNGLAGGATSLLSETDAGVFYTQATQATALAVMAATQLSMDIAGALLLWNAIENIHRSNVSVRYRISQHWTTANDFRVERTADKRKADRVNAALISVAASYRNAREAFCDLTEARYFSQRARIEAAIATATSNTLH